MKENNSIQARWLTLQDASTYCGLSVRLLQDHIRNGLVVASNVIAPGATRGRRLICRESLDAFIEEGIGKVSELKMNSSKPQS